MFMEFFNLDCGNEIAMQYKIETSTARGVRTLRVNDDGSRHVDYKLKKIAAPTAKATTNDLGLAR